LIRNYFHTSFRNLIKNRLFFFLNIVGLAIGMAACLLITQYVFFESNYDQFNTNAENLYRVTLSYSGNIDHPGSATSHPTVGPTLKMEFPEVQDFCRFVEPLIMLHSEMALKYTDDSGNSRSYREYEIYFADSSVFTMFSFPVIAGNPARALAEPNAIAVSESMARKYFGTDDPIGKPLKLMGVLPLKVTAVFEDIPEQSHIRFNGLISYETLRPMRPSAFNSWKFPEFYNYLLLKPGTGPGQLEAKLPHIVDKYLGAIMEEFGFRSDLSLKSIEDIHLEPNITNEPRQQGDIQTIRLYIILGVFIILIAWINYINLTTARSFARAREVGLRKVIGSKRSELVNQFLAESFVVNAGAVILGMILAALVWTDFQDMSGKYISRTIWSSGLFRNPHFWWLLVVFVCISTLVSGLYPAYRLSSFQPAKVLKGKFYGSLQGIRLRKALVFLQFAITMVLIGSTYLNHLQMRYMLHRDPGFRKENILVVRSPAIWDSTTWSGIQRFKKDLQQLPGVVSLACVSDIPGERIESVNTFRRIDQNSDQESPTAYLAVDEHFYETFDISLLAGRYFHVNDSSVLWASQNNVMILNRKAAEALDFQDPLDAIGQEIYIRLPRLCRAEIIGVIENHHQRSLREEYDPLVLMYPTWSNSAYYCIQIRSQGIPEMVESVRNAYNMALPDNPFDYFFLDDHVDRQYRSDQQARKMFGAFALLAILIACLGIYGLSMFMTGQRRKELGIRKVLGASSLQNLGILLKDYLVLILISLLVAGPGLYWFGQKWLENFAFRIAWSWGIILVPVLVLLLVTLVTIIGQSLKAALENPVHALRYE